MTNEEFVEAVKYILNHELLSLNDKNNSKENPLILVDKEARLNRYDVICSYIKELEAEKKSIENFFKSEMDGYETAYIGDRKLTLKNQSRSTIDTQKLRTELPDIAKAYTKTATSKVLKISQRVLKKV
jgi:predicted phage-related endonuclease